MNTRSGVTGMRVATWAPTKPPTSVAGAPTATTSQSTGPQMPKMITVAAPNGESIADVSARVARARRRILDEHAGRTVLVVSHVTPIKLLLAAGLGVGDGIVHRVFLEAASLSTVTWSSDGRATVRLVNDTSHLS